VILGAADTIQAPRKSQLFTTALETPTSLPAADRYIPQGALKAGLWGAGKKKTGSQFKSLTTQADDYFFEWKHLREVYMFRVSGLGFRV
jgi:hypothetical protein